MANRALTKAAPALLAAAQDWLWYAEGELHEFDIDGDECDPDGRLCPKCEDVGCIQLKIRLLRSAIAKATGAA